MTFVEAAASVLEQEGRPLHSREIAELAVDRGLLSHVGKTPVQTMSARLSGAVAKGRGEGPFVRIRPGVFGLSGWQGKPPGPAKPAPTEEKKMERRDPRPVLKEAPTPSIPAPRNDSPRPGTVSPGERSPNREADKRPLPPMKPESPPRDAPRSSSETQPSGDTSPSPQRKRRRRKRKTSNGSASPSQPLRATDTPESLDRMPSAPAPAPAPASASAPAPAPASTPAPTKPVSAVVPRTPERREDIIERVEGILRRATRPLPAEQVFEQAGLKGDNGNLLLDAVISADGYDRASRGLRPRFVKHKSGYGLLEREISSEIIALEQQAFEVRKRLVQISEKQVLRKLRSLPMSGFVRVMILFLQRSGFGDMVPVDLSRNNEFHLSVQDRRHQGRFRTAVVLRRDAADYLLSPGAVMDLRGSMHHYNAMGGMILTTGQTGESAINEGRVANLPPVALLNGESLATEMVRLGIGVKERPIPLPAFDEQFFSTLES